VEETEMPFLTRSQRDMKLAAEKIAADIVSKDFAMEYKGLCHQFPVFVLQCGLAQAVAFSEAKAQGDNSKIKQAHARLLEHLGAVHGKSREEFVRAVREAPVGEYMRLTRRTLDAAIFFKRFAEALISDKQKGQGDAGNASDS
jgi:CRISPR-associated protein Cmr5